MITFKVIIPRMLSGEAEGEIVKFNLPLDKYSIGKTFWLYGGKYQRIKDDEKTPIPSLLRRVEKKEKEYAEGCEQVEDFHCPSCKGTGGHHDLMEEDGQMIDIMVCNNENCGWWG